MNRCWETGPATLMWACEIASVAAGQQLDVPRVPTNCGTRVNLGRYSFTASTPAAGALRSLRDPDVPELDEDDVEDGSD
ncbi:hypothetical protein AB0D37_39720 [Streptomyces sp. NPDC048384]|uniref:hypothetical protein n=1 Tax=Streptomyces sp. NPDC048384 TaxID=3155487 RepID=UPI003412F134